MHCFFFGPADSRLFGALDLPAAEAEKGCGAVLCYPLGHEYFRSHRAFRQLARRLARAGYPTLRFDYHGSGDSMGSEDQIRLSRCRDDVARAVAELRDRARVERVVLVGRRLGADLAAETALRQGELAGLVLWDPLVRGRPYLESLEAGHREWMTAYRGRTSQRLREPEELERAEGEPMEALGLTLEPPLVEEIERLDLTGLTPEGLPPTLVIGSGSAPEPAELAESWRSAGAACRFAEVADRKAWILEELLPQLVPTDQIGVIVDWFEETV